MNILEKKIRVHTGGGCELSSITIRSNGNVYIGIYTNTDGYSLYVASDKVVETLKSTNDLFKDYMIEGLDFNYYDLVTIDCGIIEKFDMAQDDYEEPGDEYNEKIVESYLLNKMLKYLNI